MNMRCNGFFAVREEMGGCAEALGELLPRLIETHSENNLSEYLNRCSELLERLRASSSGAKAREAQEACDVFFAALPEEVRRFFLWMGGVPAEELLALLDEAPALGGALKRLALAAPAIQAVRPARCTMTIDPISNRLTALDVLGAGEAVLVARRHGTPVLTAVSFDCPEHMRKNAGFRLTSYDKCLLNGVVSLLESGNTTFSLPMLYHAMTGRESLTVDAGLLDELRGKLDVLRCLSIRVDLAGEVRAGLIRMPHGAEGSLLLEGRLLPLKRVSGAFYGRETELYELERLPPLHRYAKLKSQLASVPLELLRAPLNNNFTTIPLKAYLLRRIEAMKNNNNKVYRDKILFQSVYSELGEKKADKKRKKRIRDYTVMILAHFVEREYLCRFELSLERRSPSGVRVWWEGKQEHPPQNPTKKEEPV